MDLLRLIVAMVVHLDLNLSLWLTSDCKITFK